MAQSGFTPISLYFSATGAAVPAPGDLVAGELAINTNDGKLYYKNSSGVVTLLASATTVTNSFSAGTTGLTPNTATTGAVTLAGTLAVANGGTGLTAGTSGGVLAYTAAGTLASSTALAASALVIGGGAGAAPSTTTTGTGVVTALGVNTGTAGAFVVNGGALGTPSSGTVTNLTGTASININGTVGATTATTGAFTTVSATTTASTAAVTINGTNATGGTFFLVQRSGVAKSYFGSSISISGVGTANDTDVYAVGDGRLFGGDQTTNFTKFTSTGLAVTGSISATTTGKVGTTLGVGAATPSSSGAGITFPATQSASTDANTLDDYEEGTWTPSDGSGAGLVFTGVTGNYTKIGRMVTAICSFTYPSTVDTTLSLVAGLPPTINAGSSMVNISIGFKNGAAASAAFMFGLNGTATFRPINSAGAAITNASISLARFDLQITYFV